MKIVQSLLALLFLLTPIPAHAEPDAVDLDAIRALWDAGARDSALVLVTAETERARAGADSQLLMQLLHQEGIYRTSFGDGRRAEALLREAVALAEARPDSMLLVSAVRWLGAALGSQGRGTEAYEHSLRVRELAEALNDSRHLGWACIGLAWHAWKQGDMDAALAEYELGAMHFSGTRDVEGELWARNGVAMVQTNRGEFEAAMASYETNLKRAREVGKRLAEAIALNDLGTLELSVGLPDRALTHFRRSAEIHGELGTQRQGVFPRLNIAVCLNILGRSGEALEVVEEAREICRARGYDDLLVTVTIKAAETLVVHGRLNDGIDRYREALALSVERRMIDRVNAGTGLADALIRQERLDEAMAELERMDEILASTSMVWQQLRVRGKLGVTLAKLGRHRDALASQLEVAERAAESGFIEFRFFALAEAAKSCKALAMPDSALTLFERAAANWESERKLLGNPEWRERRGINGRLIFTDLASLMIDRDEAEQAFDRLQSYKGRTLAERMFGPGRSHDRYLAEGIPTVDLERLRGEILAEDELLLDFYLGPEHSLLFAVDAQGLRVRKLPSGSELGDRLRSYAELLASPNAADSPVIAEVGERIADILFAEDRAILGESRRILVAPDGALNLIPFVEIPGFGDRTWTRVPSAGILAGLRGEAKARERGAWSTLALASGTGPEGETLAGALREMKQLDRRYRKVTPLRLDPDAGQFSPASLAGFDILHLAAHARRNDRNPWQSAIQFTPGKSSGELRAAQIADLSLDAHLAVLSSCGSGSGGILSGEGVLGLSSAFLGAGVPTVLATLWAVDDGATASFVESFYDALADGLPCDRALRSAQDELRSDPETAHPYYWAGFVLIGEGGLAPELQRRTSPLLPALGLSVLLILVWTGRRRER